MSEVHPDRLIEAAARLADALERTGRKIVFAESCTAGLVAATLGRTPGISRYLCGSAVVYRNQTKTSWLDVPEADLADPGITAVSEQVAIAMATGVLTITPEADFSISVTGHFGPDAPAGMDGVAFVAAAERGEDGEPRPAFLRRIDVSDQPDRAGRQVDAATQVLAIVADLLRAA